MLAQNENGEKCKYLKAMRPSLSICCEYPKVVMWNWQWDECEASCKAKGHINEKGEGEHCCMMTCTFNVMGLFSMGRNDFGQVVPGDVHWQGFVFAFMLSIDNDTRWETVINENVKQCDQQFGDTYDDFYCDYIPLSLWKVSECSYKQNYLKCPYWNPRNLPECRYAYEFVSECVSGGKFEKFN